MDTAVAPNVHTKVLIIGAGPYGIGVAQELWQRGTDFLITGDPFALWFEHTLSSMRLRSDRNASEIYSGDGRYALEHFFASHPEAAGNGSANGNGHRPQIPELLEVDVYRQYLRFVLTRLPFEVQRTRVTLLDRHEGGFRAELADGREVTARAVVVATGIGSHRYFPPVLRELSPERVLHSWDTQQIEALRNRRVLVIGSGQSAAESVDALLRGDNQVTWAMRHRPAFFGEPLRLPRPLFKLVLNISPAFYYLPQVVRLGLARTFFRTTITPNMRPAYDDPRVHKLYTDAEGLNLRETPQGITSTAIPEPFNAIVSATGYRCTLAGLPFLSPQLRQQLGNPDQPPQLDLRFQSRVPNLFFTGGISEGVYGPAQRFIFGSWQAVRQLGKATSGL